MAIHDAARMRRIYEAVQQLYATGQGDAAGVTADQIAASTGLDLRDTLLCLDILASRAVLNLTWNTDPAQSTAAPTRPWRSPG